MENTRLEILVKLDFVEEGGKENAEGEEILLEDFDETLLDVFLEGLVVADSDGDVLEGAHANRLGQV